MPNLEDRHVFATRGKGAAERQYRQSLTAVEHARLVELENEVRDQQRVIEAELVAKLRAGTQR